MSSRLDSHWSAYERAFRGLLLRSRPRRLQRGVELLQARVVRLIGEGRASNDALAEVYQRCRRQTINRLCRLRGRPRRAEQLRLLLEASLPEVPYGLLEPAGSPDFHCDAGLGGMARWLRAAGYDARFWPGVADDELLDVTQHSDAILLTTDGPLTRRAAVVWGVVPALLVPLGPGKREQFQWVARRLQLRRQAARCMDCGGCLLPVPKESVRDEIPPRTYPWCDDYFRCERCGKLLWRGTHWQRIEGYLLGQ
ncbi:MAG: hypothetical protein J5I93_01040 [Pirellulaceae bacterium]|nr:hypothetical protein [Pirellulaceae bacterium]